MKTEELTCVIESGWHRLPVGTVIKRGDKFFMRDRLPGNQWHSSKDVGEKVLVGAVYIRKGTPKVTAEFQPHPHYREFSIKPRFRVNYL